METTQIQNASSTGTAPTSTTSPTSKTNTESTNAGSTTDTKGKQPQVFASRKRNAEDRKKSQIWDHFTKAPRAECNYCGKHYACHTIVNDTSNMWSHLKVCKKFPFVVDKKQKVLVLEPKIENGELGEQNTGSLKTIGYNYDECR